MTDSAPLSPALESAAEPDQRAGRPHPPAIGARLFAEHEYELFDVVRARAWDDERVEPWYAQNLVVFAGPRADPAVRSRLHENVRALPLRVVHPDIFKFAVWRALAAFEEDPTLSVVRPSMQNFGTRNEVLEMEPYEPQTLLVRNIAPYSSMFRRSVWVDVGGYDETMPAYEDWNFWISVSERAVAGWAWCPSRGHKLPLDTGHLRCFFVTKPGGAP